MIAGLLVLTYGYWLADRQRAKRRAMSPEALGRVYGLERKPGESEHDFSERIARWIGDDSW